MKKTLKILAVILIAILVVATLSQGVLATTVNPGDIGTDYFANKGDTTGLASKAGTIMGSILTTVQVIGMGVAVMMLVILAIKYISAAPGDKADIKKHAIVYVVGAVVLFGASGILQIIKNFAGVVNAQ